MARLPGRTIHQNEEYPVYFMIPLAQDVLQGKKEIEILFDRKQLGKNCTYEIFHDYTINYVFPCFFIEFRVIFLPAIDKTYECRNPGDVL